MECCKNKFIINNGNYRVCTSCSVIHDYVYVYKTNYNFNRYYINKSCYKRKKYLRKK